MMNIVCIADEAPASAIHISTKDFGSHQVARKQTLKRVAGGAELSSILEAAWAR